MITHPQDYADLWAAVSFYIEHHHEEDLTEEEKSEKRRLQVLETRLAAIIRTTESPLVESAVIEAKVRENFSLKAKIENVLVSPEPIEKNGKVIYVARIFFENPEDKEEVNDQVFHVEETPEGDLQVIEVY